MSVFSAILGQEAAVEWLRGAMAAGRVPHAMLFAGPAGVGKGTTAALLAKWWLCEAPTGDDVCGKCAACRLVDAGAHPDLHRVYKELIRFHDKTGKSKGTVLAINVIREELIHVAMRKASMGRGKAFIVEEAERMSDEAQNACLKTLEEPYGRTIIVLLTDSPGLLLPTIRSRCQMVRFGPLPEDLVAKELAGRGIEAAAAASAARLSQGSLGVALRWLKDGVAARAAELEGRVRRLLGGDPRALEDLPEWMKTAAEEFAAAALERDELASKEQATREAIGLYLRLLSEWLRTAMVQADDPNRLLDLADAVEGIVRTEQYLDANVSIALLLRQLAGTLNRRLIGPE